MENTNITFTYSGTDKPIRINILSDDDMQSIDITKEIQPILKNIVKSACITEKLATHKLFIDLHNKYPGDDAKSDRDFRNDFMEIFSQYMDEATNLIKGE